MEAHDAAAQDSLLVIENKPVELIKGICFGESNVRLRHTRACMDWLPQGERRSRLC